MRPAPATEPPITAAATPDSDLPDPIMELVRLLPDFVATLYAAAHTTTPPAAGVALTSSQMRALVYLAHHPETTMGSLADALGSGRAATTELVTRLEEKGLVWREHDPDDRRVVVVRLMGNGGTCADAVVARWRDHIAQTMAQFPDIEPGRLAALLRALMQQRRAPELS